MAVVQIPSCEWHTYDEWVTITAQDPGFMDAILPNAGSTYMAVCADGTVWLNATLVFAFMNVP